MINLRFKKVVLCIYLPFLIGLSFLNINHGQTIPTDKKVNLNKIRQNEKLDKISPGGNRFTPQERNEIFKSIEQSGLFQEENNRHAESWELIGPSGIWSADGNNFICSGRIRDVEILDVHHIRIASSSGGLWEIKNDSSGNISYKNISGHAVTSSWNGAVATDPFDKNVILLGTGEPALRSGTGLWRSPDVGLTWQNISMDGSLGLGAFDEMEFTQVQGKVWCSGSDGVFYSENSGLTWKRKKVGNFPGMAIYSNRPDTMLVGEYNRGISRTRDGGKTWQRLSNGLPANGFYRVELSNCLSQPDVIYALFTKEDHTTLGIYKTVNGGDSWTRCTVINANGEKDVDYHWGMGWYCSFISVSPVNPNHVISGGGWYIYSNDGQDFYGPTQGQHPDFHCGGWSPDGQTAWFGNDGGLYSTKFDNLWKWEIKYNNLPITQFVTMAVSRTQPDVIIGGTQDNGLVYFNPTLKKWVYYFGDGGGVAIDPRNENKLYGTIGVSGPPLTFTNVRKFGASSGGWQKINTGLKPSGQWWRLIRTDHNEPTTLYTQTDDDLYYSYDEGNYWHHLGIKKLNILEIGSMRVSVGEQPKLYVSGPGPDTSSLMMLDLSIWEWTNITKGLPTRYNSNQGISIPHVFISENPQFPDRVFALMRGHGPQIENKIIFKSDNAGLSWENITGNLPNVPFTVVLEHPVHDNILIAGTDGFGIYLTENGGISWSLWETGLPKGAFITDIDYQKYSNDSVFVVISTYGNSILRRLLPKGDIVKSYEPHIPKFNNTIESAFFKDSKIYLKTEFEDVSDFQLKCFDMAGKCLYSGGLTYENTHTFSAQTGRLPVGLYVVSLFKKGELTGVKKCIIYE